MTLMTLKSENDIFKARSILDERGLGHMTSKINNLLARFPVFAKARVGDVKKSWDILKTVNFVEENAGKEVPILDLGSYGSELLPILHGMGYQNLHGIDLDRRLRWMPHAENIHYRMGNFLSSPYPDASFEVVTAISVLEHGFQPQAALLEIARLLRPGGFFIASVDYWSAKIDTAHIRPFGMDWCIFSEEDIKEFFEKAEVHGLHPQGELDFQSPTPMIHWKNRDFTFAWMALKNGQEQKHQL